jgi:hypothetical protein
VELLAFGLRIRKDTVFYLWFESKIIANLLLYNDLFFQHFITTLTTMIGQGAACSMVVAWPGCIGLENPRSGVVGTLQASYGVPGKEQLTAAVDLAQTMVNK